MAMGHVILSECFVRNGFRSSSTTCGRYTDLPFLVKLEERDGVLVPGKNLTAADLGQDVENAAFAGAARRGDRHRRRAEGLLGFRYGDDGVGKWNLDLGDLVPALTVAGPTGETALVHLPRFDTVDGHGEMLARGVPVRQVGEHLVCTVFDLMLAQYGVARPGCRDLAHRVRRRRRAVHPGLAGADHRSVRRTGVRVAEIARNAEESGGRSMIIMGAGICQWFHGDATYRAVLALLLLTGSMGRNGGGWAHYVGQEKCRPVTGWATMAMATDWCARRARWPAPRTGTPTPTSGATTATGPTRWPARWPGAGSAISTRWMWLPPRWRWAGRRSIRSSTGPASMSPTRPAPPGRRSRLRRRTVGAGELKLAVTDPTTRNWPRVLDIWRANLLGSSSKGNEYFLRHLLGTTSNLQAQPAPEALRPNDVAGPMTFPRASSTC